jgi:hypothetical protein
MDGEARTNELSRAGYRVGTRGEAGARGEAEALQITHLSLCPEVAEVHGSEGDRDPREPEDLRYLDHPFR